MFYGFAVGVLAGGEEIDGDFVVVDAVDDAVAVGGYDLDFSEEGVEEVDFHGYLDAAEVDHGALVAGGFDGFVEGYGLVSADGFDYNVCAYAVGLVKNAVGEFAGFGAGYDVGTHFGGEFGLLGIFGGGDDFARTEGVSAGDRGESDGCGADYCDDVAGFHAGVAESVYGDGHGLYKRAVGPVHVVVELEESEGATGHVFCETSAGVFDEVHTVSVLSVVAESAVEAGSSRAYGVDGNAVSDFEVVIACGEFDDFAGYFVSGREVLCFFAAGGHVEVGAADAGLSDAYHCRAVEHLGHGDILGLVKSSAVVKGCAHCGGCHVVASLFEL